MFNTVLAGFSFDGFFKSMLAGRFSTEKYIRLCQYVCWNDVIQFIKNTFHQIVVFIQQMLSFFINQFVQVVCP